MNVPRAWLFLASLLPAGAHTAQAEPAAAHGRLVTETLHSTVLQDNRIGIDPERRLKVYLPPSYATSGSAYPVVYYLHNAFWDNERMFEDGVVVRRIEQGFAAGTVREFILVAADYRSPTTGSLYENSPVSGRWLDYTVGEVVPHIERRFRTLRGREHRAVVGDFFGGRGALALGMRNPDVFGVVYAMHPVATGEGDIPSAALDIDWRSIYAAKRYEDVDPNGRARLFVAISQAFVPNPARPPFYCDFYMQPDGEGFRLDVETSKALKAGFLLDRSLEASADNLRSLRGLAFDWGRFDVTQAHVKSNRAFSLELENLGIEHEAEEYRGDPWNRTWIEHGRFQDRVLPFLERHLAFD